LLIAPDLCILRPCLYGTCTSEVKERSFNYTCTCDEGYSGRLCDSSKLNISVIKAKCLNKNISLLVFSFTI